MVTVYVDKPTWYLEEGLSWTALVAGGFALVLFWLAKREKQRLWDERVLGVKR